MKIAVVSPKCTSKSARYIAENLGAYYENPFKTGRYDFTEYDSVINWGCSTAIAAPKQLNHFDSVRKAVDKTVTLSLLAEKTTTISYTKSVDTAISWLKEGSTVVGRLLKGGNRSKGVDFLTSESQILAKPYKFFTKYLEHIGEFRINVFKGRIISILEKEQQGDEFKFKLIRGEPIPELVQMCKAVDENLGLDFYGLDVVFDEDNVPYLLEVNSAPMLFGTTGVKFVSLLKKELV